jgi:vancomycin resistance protein VanJ
VFKSRLGRCTLLVFVLLFAVWLAQNWVGERTGFTALLLYLPQHGWGLPPLLLLFLALRSRNWRLALLNGAVLVLWAQFMLGYQFFRPFSSSDGFSNTTRLMTYNIQRGAGGIDALEAAIRAQKPDIVCLQESQGRYKNRDFSSGAALAKRFPTWSVARSGDVMTLSRFEIESQRSYPLRGTRRILETTYATSVGPLRVLNVHVSTSFAGQPYPPRTIWNRFLKVAREAQPAAQTRLDQIAPLRDAIENGDKSPLLVAGDFNSPPRGLFFRAISRGLNNAWRRGGIGTGHTFPTRFPVLPIDHVLSRGLHIESAHVPAVRASDHRPLVVDFWS